MGAGQRSCVLPWYVRTTLRSATLRYTARQYSNYSALRRTSTTARAHGQLSVSETFGNAYLLSVCFPTNTINTRVHTCMVHTCRGVLAAVGTITGQPRIVNRDGSLRGVRDGGYDQRHCWACRLVIVATVAKL